MQLANIAPSKLFVSKTNMRHADTAPDVSDILPTVKARGVIVPLIVRPGEDEGRPGMFGIVAGSRRRRATEIALSEGIDHGPCHARSWNRATMPPRWKPRRSRISRV